MSSNDYTNYWEPCALCGIQSPKRDLNKILFTRSHVSVTTPKKLCGVCDDCLPKLFDYLEITEPPDAEKKPFVPRRWCRKCVTDVGKTAVFCPYCGDRLDTQEG